MKNLLFKVFILCSCVSIAQSGLKNGDLFLLQEDNQSISVNSFENNSIQRLKTFAIPETSMYATDQKSKVVVLNTATKKLTLFDIHTDNKKVLKIPFSIKPETLLLTDKNLFIGGKMKKEMLIQYHLQSEKWYALDIPSKIKMRGKAVDDLVMNENFLIAIDNIVIPKYVLFYTLNPSGKLALSHFKKLKYNGAYEEISQGRITDKYFGMRSSTFSGYTGATGHITIYNNLNLESSFALSSNERKKTYQHFTDFVIIGDTLVIASKKKGLGIFYIKESYFKGTKDHPFNSGISISKIKYKKTKGGTIIKLTLVPNTDKFIMTLQNKQGKIRHEIKELK